MKNKLLELLTARCRDMGLTSKAIEELANLGSAGLADDATELTQSIYKERTDTITQVVEVERPLKFREKVMMNIGGFAMIGLVLVFGIGILKLTRKL